MRTPRSVPQSSSRMMTSCETSTSRRVRYPESAVRSAVSARPLRAPWVEMKNSSTDRPSRKLALIGRGMISPLGLATRPRMPAICRICIMFPRAPEPTIMWTGLYFGKLASISRAAHRCLHCHLLTGHPALRRGPVGHALGVRTGVDRGEVGHPDPDLGLDVEDPGVERHLRLGDRGEHPSLTGGAIALGGEEEDA